MKRPYMSFRPLLLALRSPVSAWCPPRLLSRLRLLRARRRGAPSSRSVAWKGPGSHRGPDAGARVTAVVEGQGAGPAATTVSGADGQFTPSRRRQLCPPRGGGGVCGDGAEGDPDAGELRARRPRAAGGSPRNHHGGAATGIGSGHQQRHEDADAVARRAAVGHGRHAPAHAGSADDHVGDVVRTCRGSAAPGGEQPRSGHHPRNSSSADFFVDGVRDDVQYYRDLYNLDRVEALKGRTP